jgi:hypothetical protein
MVPRYKRWKWVQVEGFIHPPHPEWDVIQWNCEEELTSGPRKVSEPLHDPPDDWWTFKTKDAPGLSELPATVVLFRIDKEPTCPEELDAEASDAELGVIEGWEAWWDDDLNETLMRRVQGRPVS